jgi:hypothetical protein
MTPLVTTTTNDTTGHHLYTTNSDNDNSTGRRTVCTSKLCKTYHRTVQLEQHFGPTGLLRLIFAWLTVDTCRLHATEIGQDATHNVHHAAYSMQCNTRCTFEACNILQAHAE